MVLSPACLASTAADDDGDGDTSGIVRVQFSSNYQKFRTRLSAMQL